MAAAAQAKDFYKVLGVGEKADGDEIKKAYRKLAKRYHPDANQGDDKAAERFKEVGEAYSVLSDPQKRKQYDQMRKLGSFGFGPRPGGGRPGGAPGADPGFSFDDFQGGFGNISGREAPTERRLRGRPVRRRDRPGGRARTSSTSLKSRSSPRRRVARSPSTSRSRKTVRPAGVTVPSPRRRSNGARSARAPGTSRSARVGSRSSVRARRASVAASYPKRHALPARGAVRCDSRGRFP